MLRSEFGLAAVVRDGDDGVHRDLARGVAIVTSTAHRSSASAGINLRPFGLAYAISWAIWFGLIFGAPTLAVDSGDSAPDAAGLVRPDLGRGRGR